MASNQLFFNIFVLNRLVRILIAQSSKTVKVHFDRRTELSVADDLPTRKSNNFSSMSVLSHGAWSAKGRRKSQEDTFGM